MARLAALFAQSFGLTKVLGWGIGSSLLLGALPHTSARTALTARLLATPGWI
jgi:hypothetical protein